MEDMRKEVEERDPIEEEVDRGVRRIENAVYPCLLVSQTFPML